MQVVGTVAIFVFVCVYVDHENRASTSCSTSKKTVLPPHKSYEHAV